MLAALTLPVLIWSSSNADSQSGPLMGITYDEIVADFRGGDIPRLDDFDALASDVTSSRDPVTHYTRGVTDCENNRSDDDLRAVVTLKRSGRMQREGSIAPLPEMQVSLVRHATLGTFQRDEDLLARRAWILRPDRQQWIYLNLELRRYRIEPVATPRPLGTPDPEAVAFGESTARIEDKLNVKETGTEAIRGGSVDVYSVKWLRRIVPKDPARKVFESQEVATIYVASTKMPELPCPRDDFSPLPLLGNLLSPTNAMPPSVVNLVRERTGDPFPAGRLVLQVIDQISGFGGEQPMRGIAVVLRAHVAPLTGADAGLFDVPAGFTYDPGVSGRPVPRSPSPTT
jgi:hypothetical protein